MHLPILLILALLILASWQMSKNEDQKAIVTVEKRNFMGYVLGEEDIAGERTATMYDVAGNKVRIHRYASDSVDKELTIQTSDELETQITDFNLYTKDGKRLLLDLNTSLEQLKRLEFNAVNGELIVRTGADTTDVSDQNRVKIRVDNNDFRLIRSGVSALISNPIIIKDETGEIFLRVTSGDAKLVTMPDTIVQRAVLGGDIDEVGSIVLSENTKNMNAGALQYVLDGKKLEKFIGVFEVKIANTVIYDAVNGELLDVSQPFGARILDILSF